jgi:hypothetical protein
MTEQQPSLEEIRSTPMFKDMQKLKEDFLNKLAEDLDLVLEQSINIFLAYLKPGLSKKEVAKLIHSLIKVTLQDTHFNFVSLLNDMENHYEQVNFEERVKLIELKK